MKIEVTPAEGAERGSFHWLKHKDGEYLLHRWDGDLWLELNCCSEVYADEMAEWWSYSHPASPDDAAARAEARAEVAALQRDLADARGAIHRLMHEGSAQIAALTAENAELRADAERFQWLLNKRECAYSHADEEHIFRIPFCTYYSSCDNLTPRELIDRAIQRERASDEYT